MNDCIDLLKAEKKAKTGSFKDSIDTYRIMRKRLCLEAVYMSFAHTLSLLEYLIQSKLSSLDDYEWLIMFKYKLAYS